MQDLKLESHCGFALSFFEFSLVVVWTADEDSYFFSGWLSRHGWPFGSFGKGLASQLWGRSSIPRRLFLWARNPALSSWANAATACGDPKIATAHCAITCCITLLYCVRMPRIPWFMCCDCARLSAMIKACKLGGKACKLHTQEESRHYTFCAIFAWNIIALCLVLTNHCKQ